MRVLHVYKDYFPVVGGIENHLRLLAEAQAARGLDVTVLVTNPSRQTTVTEMNGVRVIRAGRLAHVASTPLSLSFWREMGRLEADIVHLQFPYPPGEIANLLLHPGRRTVISYHSDVVRQRGILRLYHPLLRQVLQHADRIIASSPQYVESSPYLREVADNCSVIPWGIDPSPFLRFDERAIQLRAQWQAGIHAAGKLQISEEPWPSEGSVSRQADTDGGRPLILFVGRLRYYKGLPYLLQAMQSLAARLLIVGSGPLEKELRRQVQQLGLQEQVFFAGHVADEDLPAYYQAADIFVLPASHRSEAYGLVQLEAMAAGLPVVSTELGTGTSFVNQDGETGFVVPPRDAQALAQALNRLLADPALRRAMGRRGRQRVLKHFSIDKMVDQIIAVYHAVLAN